jgi:hypothetical protein
LSWKFEHEIRNSKKYQRTEIQITKTPFGTHRSQGSGGDSLFQSLRNSNFGFGYGFRDSDSDLNNERLNLRHTPSNMTIGKLRDEASLRSEPRSGKRPPIGEDD